MKDDAHPLLGGLTARAFLARYWQKRPLLVRQALAGFRDPVTPERLAALACRPDVESRLVRERSGPRPWEVTYGPQEARLLGRLPKTHWTLLVQDTNVHVAALDALLDRFDFVPRWRVDDVMVSFAPPGGTVGPHVDSYDVFLIQGRGRRRWEIDPGATPDFEPGLDLRILRRFRPARSWTLESGDMLYLPPGVGHHGVALEDCLTYSVGFRAPSQRDLVVAWAERLVEGASADARYSDPDLRPPSSRGELSAAALARLGRLAGAGVRGRPELERALGALLTRPKGIGPRPRRHRGGARALAASIRAGRGLRRAPGSRVAFTRRGGGAIDFFVDGVCWTLPRPLAFAAPLLSEARDVGADVLARHLGRPGFAALLLRAVEAGAFRLR